MIPNSLRRPHGRSRSSTAWTRRCGSSTRRSSTWTPPGRSTSSSQGLFPRMRAIIDAYHSGTHFGIHADSDGLITAGDASTQLTWMDAKCDGIVFTPRCGKAVEVNALWHNALRRMQKFCEEQKSVGSRPVCGAGRAGRPTASASCSGIEQQGYLNDTIRPDGILGRQSPPEPDLRRVAAVRTAADPAAARSVVERRGAASCSRPTDSAPSAGTTRRTRAATTARPASGMRPTIRAPSGPS